MQRGILSGYLGTIADAESKRRYEDKLKLVNGVDPYEISRNEWQDDIDLWPATTHINVCMYLILSPSPYTQADVLNYKSMDCYQNFVRGWVRGACKTHRQQKNCDWQGESLSENE